MQDEELSHEGLQQGRVGQAAKDVLLLGDESPEHEVLIPQVAEFLDGRVQPLRCILWLLHTILLRRLHSATDLDTVPCTIVHLMGQRNWAR